MSPPAGLPTPPDTPDTPEDGMCVTPVTPAAYTMPATYPLPVPSLSVSAFSSGPPVPAATTSHADLTSTSTAAPIAPFPPFAASTPKARPRRGDPGTRSRPLSDNELSYYLPSRGDGVNDMYVHYGVRAPPARLSHARVRIAWALELVRHPLLASTISMRAYDNIAFVHAPPRSVEAALGAADARMQYLDPSETKDKSAAVEMEMDIVNAYLNGPRTMGNDMLACLVVRRGTRRTTEQYGACGPADEAATATAKDHFEVMLCTTHYVGDGMALHTFMNELYSVLGGAQSDSELLEELEIAVGCPPPLPPALEDRLGLSRFQVAVGDVAQRRSDALLLGGQVLPVVRGRPRHTTVPTHAFGVSETAAALAKCKAHGVTIAHVVFALCAVAWSKMCEDRTQPTMIYSALNMRPHLTAIPSPSSPSPSPASSFFHLALGYFNVVLPSLASLPPVELVWYRAQQTKAQTLAAVKSPLSKAMFRATASARAARSQHWAAIDDATAAKTTPANPGLGLGITLPEREAPRPDPEVQKEQRTPPPLPAGKALMGVSMLGNLDAMYAQAVYGGIELFGLTTGSRQRPGGLLLFAYTLAGKLWISLGYDRNGFKDGVIERFWHNVLGLAHEVLVS